jgi:hypothetical protein
MDGLLRLKTLLPLIALQQWRRLDTTAVVIVVVVIITITTATATATTVVQCRESFGHTQVLGRYRYFLNRSLGLWGARVSETRLFRNVLQEAQNKILLSFRFRSAIPKNKSREARNTHFLVVDVVGWDAFCQIFIC